MGAAEKGQMDAIKQASTQEDLGTTLMLAYQAGDEAAFDQLVDAYSGRLFALFTRFLGTTPGREDLVQEVFLRLIRTRERYQPTARFSTFLYRIAFNLATNERGRAHLKLVKPLDRTEDEGLELEDERAPLPAAELEREDVVTAVRRAIAHLPEKQRMALVLAKYEGLAYEEIAGVLGSTEKAIKSLIHRARESLRESLSSFLQEGLA